MKPALFSNALSLYNRQYAGRIEAAAATCGLPTHSFDATAFANPATLDAMLQREADTGCDTLFINGGDGTLDFIIARLRGETLAGWNPDILLLRGGTTNMTHRDVGYGADPVRALDRALRRDTPWTRTLRDVICLSGGDLPFPQYGFFFGSHAIARAIRRARGSLHARGIHGVAGEALLFLSALSALLRGKVAHHPIVAPAPLDFNLHGQHRQEHHIFFIATTLNTLLLGMRAATPTPQRLGCMALLAPVDGFWRHIPSLWRGTPEQYAGCLLRWYDHEITLAMEGEVTLDGELFSSRHAAPLTLTIAPPVAFLT
ncbi:MAG: diacylglycerol kinase family protein [Alphaproteobacteria bacterium]|nr:diacylglycerol kinase family protein [Alphaproteobacteria bacterium]